MFLTRRNPSVPILVAALVAMIALPAAAQTAPAAPDAAHHPFAHLLRCLSVARLTDAQKADVKAIFETARPQAETILATLRADREALVAALRASPPDPCAVGKAALALHEERESARSFFEGVRDQVFTVLSPVQRAKVLGCIEAFPRVATLEGGAGEEPIE